jgi:hypothetical protein
MSSVVLPAVDWESLFASRWLFPARQQSKQTLWCRASLELVGPTESLERAIQINPLSLDKRIDEASLQILALHCS